MLNAAYGCGENPKLKNKNKSNSNSNSSKFGGPVNSNTFIPRYTTMPFGN